MGKKDPLIVKCDQCTNMISFKHWLEYDHLCAPCYNRKLESIGKTIHYLREGKTEFAD